MHLISRSIKLACIVPTTIGALGLACGSERGSMDAFGASAGTGTASGAEGGPGGGSAAGTGGAEGNSEGSGGMDTVEDGGGPGPGSGPVDDGGEDTSDEFRFDLPDADADPGGNTPPEQKTCGEGGFVFNVPYQRPPDPSRGTIDCSGGSVTKADVVLSMDTSSSMQSMINGVSASFSEIVADLGAEIPDIAFGAGWFRDFPVCGMAGASGDQPWMLVHRVMTVSTPAGLDSVQSSLRMTADGGGDGPESAYQALHEIATGQGVAIGGATVPPFNGATAYPTPPPAGERVGDIGGVGFRSGSLPIVVVATDTKSHNCASSPENDYPCSGAATCGQATQELIDIGARMIALLPAPLLVPGFEAALEAEWAKTEGEFKNVAIPTGGVVAPSAWSIGGATRPAGCAPDQCCTGADATGRPPEPDGQCPLVFRMGTNWMGVGASITTAIKVLAKGGSFNISAAIEDDPSDTVDAVAEFVDYIEASASNTPPCTGGHMTDDSDGDGHSDRFINLTTGESVCFDLIPKPNVTVPGTDVEQRFKAYVDIQGSGVTSLGRIEVTFVVPPWVTPG